MKKNQTRMATALVATLLLSAHVVSAQEARQSTPESGKPGFFRQLGTSLKNAGQEMIGVKPAGATTQASGNQPIYAPVSGAGSCPGSSNPITTSLPSKADWTGLGSP